MITKPTLIIDEIKAKANIKKMADIPPGCDASGRQAQPLLASKQAGLKG
ncbi:MAG: hypothetical protein WAU01_00360 [Saprospiraceae bacterium]